MLCLLNMKRINTVSLLNLLKTNIKMILIYSYISSFYTEVQRHDLQCLKKKKKQHCERIEAISLVLGLFGSVSHDDTRKTWVEFAATTSIDREERHPCCFVQTFSFALQGVIPILYFCPISALSYPRATSHSVSHVELISLESQTHWQRKRKDGCYNKQPWKNIVKGTFGHDVIPKTFPMIKGSTVHKINFPSSLFPHQLLHNVSVYVSV